jgi:hypothetical protein
MGITDQPDRTHYAVSRWSEKHFVKLPFERIVWPWQKPVAPVNDIEWKEHNH